MSKQEIIDRIMVLNEKADPEFLAQFALEELGLYLEHLMDKSADNAA